MSGHSKWSTIKRQKGINDVKRGMSFTKISNAITLAAKLGNSGDLQTNPRLRLAIEQARAVNMPKDNIQRAIDKGLGNLPGQTIEEVLYEGFGPGKVAYIVEGITDNKLRTTAEVKNLFTKSGGNMSGQGSVSFMFDHLGEIKAKTKGGGSDDEMLEIIDLGAKDVEELEEEGAQNFLIYTEPTQLFEMSNKLTQNGFEVESSEIIFKPNLTVEIKDKEVAEKVLSLAEKLDMHDDVHKVYANFDITEGLVD